MSGTDYETHAVRMCMFVTIATAEKSATQAIATTLNDMNLNIAGKGSWTRQLNK